MGNRISKSYSLMNLLKTLKMNDDYILKSIEKE